MFLDWITQMVKQAVLKGFRLAVEELNLETPPDEFAALKVRLEALPAPSKKDKK